MKKLLYIILLIIFLLIIVALLTRSLYNNDKVKVKSMRITSSVFQNNQEIPSKYTCNGENINPSLLFSDIPAYAKSLVLIVDDPDAPGGTWVHWVVYNIDPQTKEITENSVPSHVEQGMTSFGKPGYGGPCPPSGTHHYHFKLYALDVKLQGLTKPDKATIEQSMQGHIIEQSEIIGLYSKK